MVLLRFREFFEVFTLDKITSHKPENGYWEPSLEVNSRSHVFRYSVPGDESYCKSLNSTEKIPCYYVNIECKGRQAKNVYIDFGHETTGFGDRWNYIGKNMSIANNQMYSALNAISEYVQTKNPETIQWNATVKDRPGAKNLNARTNVYFLWASRIFYPKYVPISDILWVRSDYYPIYKTNYPNNEKWPAIEKTTQISAKDWLKQINLADSIS